MPHFATTQAKVPRQSATSFAAMPGSRLQRKCACGGPLGPAGECEACRKRRESKSDQLSEIPPIVHEVLNSPGQQLDPATRAFMEPRFGYDFGNVRVHTDAKAADSARAVHAHAYTVGQDVVFGLHEFAPATHQGRELLAHELAHTIQQRRTGGAAPLTDPHGVYELSADAAARDVSSGRAVALALPACGIGLSRAPVPPEAFDDQELTKQLQDVTERLKQPNYQGRDRHVDWRMWLHAISDQRARAAAVAEAEATAGRIGEDLKQTEAEEKAEQAERNKPVSYVPTTLSPLKPDRRFAATQFDYENFEREANAKKEAEAKAKAAAQKKEEEGRPARLALLRRYLTLHGVSKWDAADVLTEFLTVNDLRVLQANGLEAPGFFSRHYSDKVIDVIDKIVPRDPIEDQADLEDLQRRAAAYERTAEKIEGLSSEGPHALAGRIVGATTAYAVGKNPLWGSEVGAAFGGLAGVRSELRYGYGGAFSSTSEEPVLTESTVMEPALSREPMPTPGSIEPLVAPREPVSPGKPTSPTGSLERLPPSEPAATVSMQLPAAQKQLPPDPTPTARTQLAPNPTPPTQKQLPPGPPPKPPVQQGNPRATPKAKSTKTQTGATTAKSRRSTTQQTKAEKEAKYNDTLDKRIARVRNELSEAKQRTIEYKGARAAAGEKQKGGPFKAIWNKEEELYVLERARTYPNRTILEQVELVGVKGKDGSIKSSAEIAGEGRTVDFLEIDGGKVLGGEVKSKAELVHSVESLKEPGMEGGFKATTSKVGQQRSKEQLVIDFANTQGGNLIFKGKDVRTGEDFTIEVDTKDYRSTVVAYDQIMPN